MRIAIFSDAFYPELSGITDSIISTGTQLAEDGHQVEFFVPHYSKKAYKVADVAQKEIDLGPNVKIHRVLAIPVKTPTMQGHAVIPNPLRGFLVKSKFDIVHSHGFFGAGIDAFFFSKIKSAPLVGTNHTLIESFVQYFPYSHSFIEKVLVKYVVWYYNLCDFVTAPSIFLIDNMKKKGLKIKSGHIPNPVASEFYDTGRSKDILKKEFHFGGFTALYAGRLSIEKNPESMVKGFISFAEGKSDANLIIVGQGMLREKLEKMVAESNVPTAIKFMGPYMGDHKKTLYDIFHASDIFVMPSTSENQSMVVIQAMASGLPTIAARAGGSPELVGNDKGLFFEPDNVKEIVDCLENLYKNQELRKKFGENAVIFAKRQSADEISRFWQKKYHEVIQTHTNG